jgi:hypothetical protein
MQQQEIRMLGRLDGPSVVPPNLVAQFPAGRIGYRAACRYAWQAKRISKATRAQLAAECGLYASHVSDYLHADDGPKRRDLPAYAVHAFDAFVGNTLLSQWMALHDKLTVVEEMQAMRLAA